MLTQWTLANFKSFREKTTLELAPITVLAGANSSGKSSIIQSILLLKQTIQYVPVARAVGLNGPLLKLGYFEDVRSVGSVEEVIEFGWKLDDVAASKRSLNYSQPYNALSANYGLILDSVGVNVSFGIGKSDKNPEVVGPSREELHLQPHLHKVAVSTEYHAYGDEKKVGLSSHITLSRLSRQLAAGAIKDDIPIPNLQYKVDSIDEDTKRQLTQQRPEAKIIGADTRHFFPARVGVQYNRRRDISRKITAAIVSNQDYYRYSYDPELRVYRMPVRIGEIIVKKVNSIVSQSKLREVIVRRVKPCLDQLTSADMQYTMFLENLQAITRGLDTHSRQHLRVVLSEEAEQFERIVSESLTQKVHNPV